MSRNIYFFQNKSSDEKQSGKKEKKKKDDNDDDGFVEIGKNTVKKKEKKRPTKANKVKTEKRVIRNVINQ